MNRASGAEGARHSRLDGRTKGPMSIEGGTPRVQPVESVRRALRILSCFTPERPEMGVSELARVLGMHKSTIHRLLQTLELEGFVHQVNGSRYALSWTLFAVASSIPASQALRRPVFDHLSELAGRTGETAHLAVLDQSQVLYVEKVEGSWSLRMPSAVGRRVPLHCTALGKVLLAGFENDEVWRLIARLELRAFTARTITDMGALSEDVEDVRKQGYAIDREELEEGLVCVAAPVHDDANRTCAAISIAGPAPRLLGGLEEKISAVRATAEALSLTLGPHARTLPNPGSGTLSAFPGYTS